jgi:hypothetical protein
METGCLGIKQPAKPAKVGAGTCAFCSLGMRGNITNQRITFINIHTSVAIFQGFRLFLSARHAGLDD